MSGNNLPKMLTTEDAAKALHRSVQTLRMWSHKRNGPIDPVRLHGHGGPLLWRETDIIDVLNGKEKIPPKPCAPTPHRPCSFCRVEWKREQLLTIMADKIELQLCIRCAAGHFDKLKEMNDE